MKTIENKYVPIGSVRHWEDNPRSITESDRERLQKQLKDLGQFKPLVVVEDKKEKDNFIVIGGNMRLEAMQALVDSGEKDFENVWVSIVQCKNEEEMLKIALADNDRAGYYEEGNLVPLIKKYEGFPTDNYHIDTAYTVGIDTVVDRYDMADVRAKGEIAPEDKDTVKDKKEVFDNATIKQIVLYFGSAEYKKYVELFDNYMEEFKVESNTEVVMKLAEFYEDNKSKEA